MLAKLKQFVNMIHMSRDYVLPQQHEFYELIYYASGEGRTIINGETFKYSEGTFALIKPKQIHDEMANTTTEVYCCIFTFSVDVELNIIVEQADEELARVLLKYMQYMRSALIEKSPDYLTKMEHYLQLIINELLKRYYDCIGNIEYFTEALEYAKKQIRQKYAYIVNFDSIAYSIGYSTDHFRHLFKEKYKITPNQYLLGVRMSKANELLIDTQYSIKHIAKKVGYNSDIAFINCFKKFSGVTPSTYRKIAKKGVDYLNIEKYNKK